MKIGQDRLHPFHTPLVGFGESATHPLMWIKLLFTLGAEPHQTIIWQDFIVVEHSLPYNAILGHLTLGKIKAITSMMKFPTSTGVGEVMGDQRIVRKCFILAMKTESPSKPSSQ